jgi:anti-sigma factor RsiW
MTRCPDHTEWVLYAADELPAARRAELDRHLAACDACRRDVDGLRRGLAALGSLEAAPPLRAETLAALRRRLAAEAEPTRERPARRRHHPLRWVGAAAAAAAAVIAVALLLDTEPQPVEWADAEQVDAEIAEITASLELLESDTSALAWDFDWPDEPEPSEAPPGQSRSGTDTVNTRHG